LRSVERERRSRKALRASTKVRRPHRRAQADCPTFAPGQSRASVLQAAAMAAKWWEPPRDALDAMVLGAADLGSLAGLRHTAFTPFDPTLKVARRARACV
jgi:citrate lyase beta subunit